MRFLMTHANRMWGMDNRWPESTALPIDRECRWTYEGSPGMAFVMLPDGLRRIFAFSSQNHLTGAWL